MNNNRQVEQPGSITLGDIYFVIFRHKWKIIFLSTAGIAAAVVFYMQNPPLYQSDSQLFIRYITDKPSPNPDAGSTMTSPGVQGGSVINSEIQILRSFDLAQQVAITVGPEKILAKAGGGTDPIRAAIIVRNGLIVQPAPNSSVIDIVFQHPDPSVVQPVLTEIVADYQSKHSEIHQMIGENDFLTGQTAQLRSEIAQTERDLMAAKTNAGIISVEDAKKTISDQITKIQGQLLDVEVELATRQGVLAQTNGLAQAKSDVTNVVASIPATADQIDEYKRACLRLIVLEKKNAEFQEQGYGESNTLVMEVSGQIAKVAKAKTDLEEKFPELTAKGVFQPNPDGQNADAQDETAKLNELKSKVTVLNSQLDRLRQEAAAIGEVEPKINDLTRKDQIEEQNLQYFLKSLDDARINDALGAGKISGIRTIQEPTPPSLAESKRLKISGMLAGGGIALALALAFLIELYLDRSVKRPTEIENKLKMPLFLSIPDVIRNGNHKRATQRQLRMKNDEADATVGGSVGKTGNLQIAPWSPNHSLRGFYEALRDRIVVHFEVRNITRNPKLVAVTSANRGAGVTSIAMGLAASLSETGEGNVLLVDMNAEQGAVQQFYKGKPGCPLDDAFVSEKRNGALVQNNLYVVSDSSGADKLPRIMPKRFSSLLPKFKASDYDYIIFDMPPVTQTSVTPRLAGHMDMVLLVVEAEKTKQEVVRRANSLLAESKANVVAVLNKARKYVPEKLHQEYLSDS